MIHQKSYQSGCSEEFKELCALSTSGELSDEEVAMLDRHVASCGDCAALLREYTSLAHVGMAKLAAHLETEVEAPFGYNETKAEERFVVALHASQPSVFARHYRQALWTGAAAALVVCLAGTFELGRKIAASRPNNVRVALVAPARPAPDAEKSELKAELAASQSSLKAVTTEFADQERELKQLAEAKASVVAQMKELSQKNDADSASLALVTQQRDGLEAQLSAASNALTRAQDDLTQVQQVRQRELLRLTSLETEIKGLNTDRSGTKKPASDSETVTASDPDIRELMGARQLYIADVFDVQNDGKRSKPFGRVFYTKGKSLLFYAFDLQAEPGFREARAFQAWGKPESTSAKPISLGIFYMDNEQNRRWVVKSDNQGVLAQINAVFVTVEPHGGSPKPTGRPFLEAYLHSLPPNHP
jgi:anti-sigma-K factor RskA